MHRRIIHTIPSGKPRARGVFYIVNSRRRFLPGFLLSEFNGTVLVVSHDREFLNNVVTTALAFEENFHVHEYTGGCDILYV